MLFLTIAVSLGLGLAIGYYLAPKSRHLAFFQWSQHQTLPPQASNYILAVLLLIPLGLVSVIWLKNNGTPRLLVPVVLILEAYAGPTIVSISWGLLGFLLGILVNQRKKQLFAIFCVTCFLGSALIVATQLSLPISDQIKELVVDVDGIVLQTTNTSCAAASLANLARITQKAPNLTEKEAANMLKTTRSGTSTLAILKALKKLGFSPKFESNLTYQQLLEIPSPALLHVLEPIRNRKIPHSVVYLGFQENTKNIIIANPLQGKQVIPASEMAAYWPSGQVIWLSNY